VVENPEAAPNGRPLFCSGDEKVFEEAIAQVESILAGGTASKATPEAEE